VDGPDAPRRAAPRGGGGAAGAPPRLPLWSSAKAKGRR
jgi:hypothetical protein